MTDNPNPVVDTLNASKQPALNADQSRSMIAELVKYGAMTKELAEQKLEAAGVALPPDPRTEKERAFDKTFGGADASAYKFDVASLMPDATPAEIAAAHGQFAEWASDLKLPPTIARSLVDIHLGVVRLQSKMTEAEQEAWSDREEARFIQIIGPNHAARVEAGALVLLRINGRKVNLANLARSNGATIAANLLLHAERLAAR